MPVIPVEYVLARLLLVRRMVSRALIKETSLIRASQMVYDLWSRSGHSYPGISLDQERPPEVIHTLRYWLHANVLFLYDCDFDEAHFGVKEAGYLLALVKRLELIYPNIDMTPFHNCGVCFR